MQTNLQEKVLPDHYRVYGNHLYVCDGEVVVCDLVYGNVLELKNDLRTHFGYEAKEIKNCDIEGRKAAGLLK